MDTRRGPSSLSWEGGGDDPESQCPSRKGIIATLKREKVPPTEQMAVNTHPPLPLWLCSPSPLRPHVRSLRDVTRLKNTARARERKATPRSSGIPGGWRLLSPEVPRLGRCTQDLPLRGQRLLIVKPRRGLGVAKAERWREDKRPRHPLNTHMAWC